MWGTIQQPSGLILLCLSLYPAFFHCSENNQNKKQRPSIIEIDSWLLYTDGLPTLALTVQHSKRLVKAGGDFCGRSQKTRFPFANWQIFGQGILLSSIVRKQRWENTIYTTLLIQWEVIARMQVTFCFTDETPAVVCQKIVQMFPHVSFFHYSHSD